MNIPVRRILKFGGAALADGPAIERVCRVIASEAGAVGGIERLVIVVSAHAGVTDALEEIARGASSGRGDLTSVRTLHRGLLAQLGLPAQLLDPYWSELEQLVARIEAHGRLTPIALDLALSFGERMSARVVAASVARTGLRATPVDAYDLGFLTDSTHGHARLLDGIAGPIRATLARVPGLPIVTGFLAKDRAGNLTTLGRNGSDLTASVIAEALGAEEIQFWKTVDGIFTADPELVPDARVLERLTYTEAAEYAFHGSGVLHPACVAPALRACVAVRVRNVFAPDSPGTSFALRLPARGPIAVASQREVLRVDVPVGAPERRGSQMAELFGEFERAGVQPGLVFADGDRVGALLEPGPEVLSALAGLGSGVRITGGLGALAVIGDRVGEARDLGLAAHACLTRAGVEVVQAFLGARASSQAFVVPGHEVERALRTLHARVLPAIRSSRGS